ncbi:MAG: PKD domain-containing protein, partial [Euryarchaeota archaeon]|nr:PKD domain-containing protein [Euryarchaeota archaeon]
VTHTHNTAGDMNVTLTLADAYQEKEITQVVTVYAPSLDGRFTYESDLQNPLTIIFTGVGEAETWNWEFGDGTRETGQIVTHTYNTAGDVNVTLTLADAYQEEEITQVVTIYAPPMDVDFAISLSDAYEPYTVSFFDRSYGPITNWQWYFGDGAASKEQNPVHTYASADEYTVQLIITSEYGETKMQQVRFIIPESVSENILESIPDEKLLNLLKPDIDLNGNETVVKQIAEATEI